MSNVQERVGLDELAASLADRMRATITLNAHEVLPGVRSIISDTVRAFQPTRASAPFTAADTPTTGASLTERLLAAEALFESALGPVTEYIGADGNAVDVARVLHRSIWRRFLPDMGSAHTPGPQENAAAPTPHASVALTLRETEVLHLVSEAYTNKEVATHLHIAPGTVKRHLANICEKLHAVSRLDAVRRAHQLHLL